MLSASDWIFDSIAELAILKLLVMSSANLLEYAADTNAKCMGLSKVERIVLDTFFAGLCELVLWKEMHMHTLLSN